MNRQAEELTDEQVNSQTNADRLDGTTQMDEQTDRWDNTQWLDRKRWTDTQMD
jgi:hypothetical protein